MVPRKTKFVSYYRVSTQKQGKSGLGLESQKASVQAFLSANDGIELASYVEVESGKLNSRPKLSEALARCRQTNATLLVAKLDRLSRNASFLLNLRDSGAKFQALDIPDANTLTLGVMALLAQQEREMISARTKAALAARKARGLSLGTPRDMSPYAARASLKGCATLSAKAKQRALEIAPVIQAARDEGKITLLAIAAYLEEAQVSTRRGGKWTATAVSNALKYIEP